MKVKQALFSLSLLLLITFSGPRGLTAQPDPDASAVIDFYVSPYHLLFTEVEIDGRPWECKASTG